MTTIINLYGGPSTGKSTSAAFLFHRLKVAGKNAELVREAAKDWAWEDRIIDHYSQFYLMGRQIRREGMLLGKVDFIVNDAPVMLYGFYAKRYCPPAAANGVSAAVSGYYDQLAADGHTVKHVFLTRQHKYNPIGRYQTAAQASVIDDELLGMLRDSGCRLLVTDTSDAGLSLIVDL